MGLAAVGRPPWARVPETASGRCAPARGPEGVPAALCLWAPKTGDTPSIPGSSVELAGTLCEKKCYRLRGICTSRGCTESLVEAWEV